MFRRTGSVRHADSSSSTLPIRCADESAMSSAPIFPGASGQRVELLGLNESGFDLFTAIHQFDEVERYDLEHEYRKIGSDDRSKFRDLLHQGFQNYFERRDTLNHPQAQPPLVVDYKSLPDVNTCRAGLLSKLVVVKVIDGKKLRLSDVYPIIKQLKDLNLYWLGSTELYLVGNYFNKRQIHRVAKNYSDDSLKIHSADQYMFPYITRMHDPTRNSSRFVLKRGYNSRDEKGDIDNEWYTPDDGYALCNLVVPELRKFRDDVFVLLLNSSSCPQYVDMQILQLLVISGVDLCLEVVNADALPQDEKKSKCLVSIGGMLKMVNPAECSGEFLHTNNLWIRLGVLRDQFFLEKIVLASEKSGKGVELDMLTSSIAEHCDNVLSIDVSTRVPPATAPARRQGLLGMILACPREFKLKPIFLYVGLYFLYHCITVLLAGMLEATLKSNEEAIIWIEGAVWVFLLGVYMHFLLVQRLQQADRPRDPKDRRREGRVHLCQVMLMASTRYLYTGLRKSSERRVWFKENHWVSLRLRLVRLPISASAVVTQNLNQTMI